MRTQHIEELGDEKISLANVPDNYEVDPCTKVGKARIIRNENRQRAKDHVQLYSHGSQPKVKERPKPELNIDEVKNYEQSLKQLPKAVESSEIEESTLKDCCVTPIQIMMKRDAVKSFSRKLPAPKQLQHDIKSFTISDEKMDCYQRTVIMNGLTKEEIAKFEVLEKAVAEHGYKYEPIDLVQYLIVSHLEIPESFTRMKKWREELKKWGGDEVPVSSAIDNLRENPEWSSIGGYDNDGRRIYVIHFGSIFPKEIIPSFEVFCKTVNVLWDSLTVNVPEVQAGLCLICDFQNFGTSNWSLTLLLRVLGLMGDKYPLRLRRIYFLDQPGYFLIISKIVMTFLPSWFKKRIKLVTREQLKELIPKDSLPIRVGGNNKEAADLSPWVVKRLERRYGSSWSKHYDK